MEKQFNPEQIIEEARQFTDVHIRPYAGEFDKNEALPRKLIQQMAAKGYLAAVFPCEYGGLGLDSITYGHLTEVIGKACCSTRTLLTVHTSLVGETLCRWGTRSQKERWLPAMAMGEKIAAFALSEPDQGSNAKGIQTQYVQKGDRYIINGRKKWISFADIADLFLVFASNEKAISAFMVERDTGDIKTTPIKGLLGNRAAHIAEIEFNNVEVPEKNVIGRIGSGFTYVASSALDNGRYSIAWAGVAIAQEALDAMIRYSKHRKQFGAKLASFQLIQGIIGDAVMKTHVARAICEKAGKMKKEGDADAVIETTVAKYFTSKVAMEVAIDAVQVHGGNGCIDQYPVERLFREAKILEIIEGTSQIQQSIISRFAINSY